MTIFYKSISKHFLAFAFLFLTITQSFSQVTYYWTGYVTGGTLATPYTYTTGNMSATVTNTSVFGTYGPLSPNGGYKSPKYITSPNASAPDYQQTGLCMSVNWSSVNSSTTLTMTFATPVLTPVDFTIDDINSGTCCGVPVIWKDVVQIIAYDCNGTAYYPPNANLNSPGNAYNAATGTITAGNYGATNQNTSITFPASQLPVIKSIAIVYKSGTLSNDPYTANGTDPDPEYIVVSAINTAGVLSGVVVSANQTICPGQSVTLTASGANTYVWNPGGLTGSSVSVSPTSTTSYTVTGTLTSGCTTNASTTVNMGGSLSLSASASSPSICLGTNITLSASGATNYTWSGGLTGSLVNVSPTVTTTYTVTGNTGSCTAQKYVTVTVNPKPILNFKREYYICGEAGGGAQLTASGGTTYSWSPGATLDSSTIANPLASPFITTTYIVTVSNGSCSDTAHVTVNLVPSPTAPIIFQAGDSLWITQNFASYQWYFEGSPLLNDTNFYTIVRMTGNYSVYVTDSLGCKVISQSVYAIDPTGVSDNIYGHGIEIFPNPTNGQFTVYGLQFTEKTTLEIYNVLGEKVYSANLQNTKPKQQTTLDISSFAKGVYVLQLSAEHKQYRVEIIKE